MVNHWYNALRKRTWVVLIIECVIPKACTTNGVFTPQMDYQYIWGTGRALGSWMRVAAAPSSFDKTLGNLFTLIISKEASFLIREAQGLNQRTI